MSTYIPTPPATRTSKPPAAPPSAAGAPGTAGAAGAGERQPLRWIWEALSPAERRAGLHRLRTWVEWMRARHTEPPLDLSEKIPACWHMHPGALDRLTALYAEWLRAYAADSELPLISIYDALDRHAHNLGYPGACVNRSHDDQRGAEPFVEFDTWIVTSGWAAAPAASFVFQAPAPPADAPPQRTSPMTGPPTTLNPAHAPGFVMEAAQMQQLLDAGDATQLGGAPAVRHNKSWWLGDGTLWVRVLDEKMTKDLDGRLTRWNAAEAALAKHRARTKTPPSPSKRSLTEAQLRLSFDEAFPPDTDTDTDTPGEGE